MLLIFCLLVLNNGRFAIGVLLIFCLLVLDKGRFAEFAVQICLFLFCFVVLWTRSDTLMEAGCCGKEVEDKGRFAGRSVNILFVCSGREALP